nr:glucosaminidase domain-containing protein [Vulcanibacillus modesticaldus]
MYWQLAPRRGGVNPVVAYAQFALETGFLFRGIKSNAGIDASYHNPSGLKTKAGGNDTNPNAYQRFNSWEEGITAHLDHLALYAGAQGYPREDTPDPRHFPFLNGTAKTVEQLSGKWSPLKDYGNKIVSLLREIEATQVIDSNEDIKKLKDEITNLNLKIDNLKKQLNLVNAEKNSMNQEIMNLKQQLKKYQDFFKKIKLFLEENNKEI